MWVKIMAKTFMEAGGDLDAVRFCLKGVWAIHEATDPADMCPHDLDMLDPLADEA